MRATIDVGTRPRTKTSGWPPASRVLGHHGSGGNGPFLLACAGMHGNEPAGVRAAIQVLEVLDSSRFPLRGEFAAVVGNQAALRLGRRCVDRDLNRCWTRAQVEKVRTWSDDIDREEHEQRDLLQIFDEAEQRARGDLVLVDLHTTSAPTPPFVVATPADAPFAQSLGLPVVIGLERWIRGTLLSWFVDQGHRGLVIEAGLHSDPESIRTHEKALWRLIDPHGREPHPAPPILEIVYGHTVTSAGGFLLREELSAFDTVRAGDLIGWESGTEVRAPENGLLLMPLLQACGEEAFFLARPPYGSSIRSTSR